MTESYINELCQMSNDNDQLQMLEIKPHTNFVDYAVSSLVTTHTNVFVLTVISQNTLSVLIIIHIFKTSSRFSI